ncbi:cytochrome c biogenesis protein CcdA [Thermococcus sp. 18S1]|uniref:cytochrome c biogenesis CcdA family protein n=1 Tax=Thermococcus sp. 18S1 TaxID=1638210 RepID=UPI00143AD04C|nr:cytochrome c biogenesis CcdA family protein [Thermococcus sp. 18S1]NJE30950.1 cytochrome c biogenesis protein CcdA [Thermococcus sp. 18S1]
MKSEIKGLAIILLASFGVSSLALWALGMVDFIPKFFALAMSDSINPCTFVIYTMLLIALSVREISKKRLYFIGAAFIAAVYISYYLLGVGLLYFAGYLPLWVAGVAAIIFGAYTIATGLMEKSRVGDKSKIRKKIFSSDATAIGAFTLGVIVSTTLLPCSAGSYLVYAIIISKAGQALAFLLLALYNLVFVLPLVVILLAMGSVTESKRFSQAMVRHSRELSVIAGILLIAIGVWVLTGASL